MSTTQYLFAVIGVPFVVALIAFASALCPQGRGGKLVSLLHRIGLIVFLKLTWSLGLWVINGQPLFGAEKWLYLDGLGALVLGVLSLVALVTGFYSIGYIGKEHRDGHLSGRQVALYYGLFNLFVSTMALAILSNNVIMMWVGIEATTLSSVFLVGFYCKRSSLEGAWKYIIICSVGVAFGLFGSILTFANATEVMAHPANAILWTEIRNNAGLLDPTLMRLAFVFALIGFGTKTGLFPMHAWLPDAHSEAPSPVSALLSAGLLNCALLVILRYYILTVKVLGPQFPQYLMLAFGILSVGVAAFFIFSQRDIKRKLAYSSMENMGLMTLAVGLGPVGAIAAMFHMINHSMVKALMFCGSGNIVLKYGSRDMGTVKGLFRTAPVTGLIVGAGILALSGVPPFSMFLSEFMIITAGISSGHVLFTVILLLLLTVVLAGLVKVVAECVLGDTPEGITKGEISTMTVAPLALLLVGVLAMGVYIPDFAKNSVDKAALVILDSKQDSVLAQVLNDTHLPWQSEIQAEPVAH
ncbi:hydrogenase 4 subunit F [Sansalvadorimonas verongulae]|uniref:hydrogenase 4 subunit F n=1 Tax=Sansalvadorimonas verongulae TaxID=2172824 RepID=UPI0012BCF728|nr:hydrogenase 4 subunit F [Sansalvadorimonas verongulae]MTI14542.1 hydrogenase 4 subunit F [Sansalvadorimonas verongulae]